MKTLVSPYKQLLFVEAMGYMRQGFRVHRKMKRVWSWQQFRYTFRIVLVKDNIPPDIAGFRQEIEESFKELHQPA